MTDKQILEAGLRCMIVALEGKITSMQYLQLLRLSYNLDWVA